jgi:hypothetical protein
MVELQAAHFSNQLAAVKVRSSPRYQSKRPYTCSQRRHG